LKNTQVAQILVRLCSKEKALFINIFYKKIGWATFWAIFSHTHPVALLATPSTRKVFFSALHVKSTLWTTIS
jgi:hypothetical protein